ncbi:unnamed protein product [Prorocentrum cordatum]|uniref:Polycystin domain-containing protein n=1 Tax=Prorocentrum cordatum TaxID=2364126 RepID=A0ABN9VWB3_9DINO|nr:unnamed protein product [Polarella glacialis]
MSNVMLGSVRLRQLRVSKNTGCHVSKLAAHVFPNCYASYSDSYRSNVTYAPRFGPTYLKSAFAWKDASETNQISIRGSLNTYGADGFVADLPFNRSDSAVMIRDLWNSNWVDSATRAVVIELSVLNTNVNVIVNSRILFEFSPAGSVIGKSDGGIDDLAFSTRFNAGHVTPLSLALAFGHMDIVNMLGYCGGEAERGYSFTRGVVMYIISMPNTYCTAHLDFLVVMYTKDTAVKGMEAYLPKNHIHLPSAAVRRFPDFRWHRKSNGRLRQRRLELWEDRSDSHWDELFDYDWN